MPKRKSYVEKITFLNDQFHKIAVNDMSKNVPKFKKGSRCLRVKNVWKKFQKL